MMKALQKSPVAPEHAFECRFLKAPYFDPNWHFHSEYQLFIVLKGTGTRFIGDHVQPFGAGDLVLTGPNLPHLWQSDPEYFEGDSQRWTEGIVIYFPEDFFGNKFLQKCEMADVRHLLARAVSGIAFTGRTVQRVKRLMWSLTKKKDFDGILQLLQTLQVLAASNEFHVLAQPDYANTLKESDAERMNRIHAYVMKNFRERITLNEVAALANMTPSSFSRYFKTHANRTFSEFLTSIRIGYSCKLLVDRRMKITQACYDSGFHTISNFNRQFKAYTQYSPLAYRKKFLR